MQAYNGQTLDTPSFQTIYNKFNDLTLNPSNQGQLL